MQDVANGHESNRSKKLPSDKGVKRLRCRDLIGRAKSTLVDQMLMPSISGGGGTVGCWLVQSKTEGVMLYSTVDCQKITRVRIIFHQLDF